MNMEESDIYAWLTFTNGVAQCSRQLVDTATEPLQGLLQTCCHLGIAGQEALGLVHELHCKAFIDLGKHLNTHSSEKKTLLVV
jgi:hypothetical protein